MNTAFVFPGQGSQFDGMGKNLYQGYDIARKLYDEASDILGYDLLKACENENRELNHTTIVQPAILVHSVACWNVIQQILGFEPSYLTGHSLGELSAVVCGKGLAFSKAVELVKLRGELMSECVADGGMMVVFGLGKEEITSICDETSSHNAYVGIANHNSNEQWVLSGHKSALERASTKLEDKGGVTKILNISIPAHSKLMQPAKEAFEQAIKASGPSRCQYPIVSCTNGEIYEKAEDLPRMLSIQLTQCVDWPTTMKKLIDKDVLSFVELGPKTVLRDLIRLEFPKARAIAFNGPEDEGIISRFLQPEQMDSEVNNVTINDVVSFLQSCLRVAVGTPLRKEKNGPSFEQTIHAPYRKIVSQLNELKNGKEGASISYMRQGAEQVLRLLRAKGFEKEESIQLLKKALSNPSIEAKLPEYFSA